ncbi:MAG: aminopeptidase P family protein [Ectothiorhodospiraceae bacterium AqS1]|nr:aminopeptidase P family protein [Ectothiorhodospiraceae bacterium AqS1]
MHRNPFTDEEINRRLEAFRLELQSRELDAAILSTPENVFYFTGLDHWGYFAPHLLIIPVEGEAVLVTRQMERVAIGNMVRSAEFRGHLDSESAADEAARALADMALLGKRIGIEQWSAGMSFGLACDLREKSDALWCDITGVADSMRHVKSQEEQDLLRQAARVTNAATQAAVDAIGAGVEEREVAAQCQAAMIRAGGEPVGFGPFIRPESRLNEEHTTWGHGVYRDGEAVFLEISGCVGRYHAPNGRLVHIGDIPERNLKVAEICQSALNAALGAMKEGVRAKDIYATWQGAVDDAGLSRYRRHHCGYMVGIGFPPSWSGGNRVTGLRHDSDLEIKTGMSFHIMSWLMGTGEGDFFLSECVLLGEHGPETLTTAAPVSVR